MPQPLVVINVVGLTLSHLGAHTPNLERLASEGFARPMKPVLPAVTCSAQATMLTGLLPREHGIVANGWYFRDLAEVLFWRQSNHLIQGEKIYTSLRRRDPNHTTAKFFWWYNMYADVAWSLTPRPSYPADGRKIFDSYSQPETLRDEIQRRQGVFPLLKFWGPRAGIASSRWIADAAVDLYQRHRPSMLLVYLPHLDYNLQRWGPADERIPGDLKLIDAEVGKLIAAARATGANVVVVSEYGITPVRQPIHINRVLRQAGWLRTRREPLGWESLDCGASDAFAVADHQVAHVYVSRSDLVGQVRQCLARTDGIEQVLDREQQAAYGIDHPRSGELVAVAAPGAWFTYYFWLDDRLAPDYARTVDIHRKPGYDPMELIFDPHLRLPKLRVARRLAAKFLGLRYYMDVIGLDASAIKGSHGRLPATDNLDSEGAIWICSNRAVERDSVAMTDVRNMLWDLSV